MSDLKAAKELAARAHVDLQALVELAGNQKIADEIFGFLAQQAVEKALKAGLALSGKKYPLTHDLKRLSKDLRKIGVPIQDEDDLVALNPFAVQFRYETMGESEPGLDRLAILEQVGTLVGKIQKLVEEAQEDQPGVGEPPAPYGARKTKSRTLNKKRLKR